MRTKLNCVFVIVNMILVTFYMHKILEHTAHLNKTLLSAYDFNTVFFPHRHYYSPTWVT